MRSIGNHFLKDATPDGIDAQVRQGKRIKVWQQHGFAGTCIGGSRGIHAPDESSGRIRLQARAFFDREEKARG
ncbi:MAG: hypothetical protein ACLQLH_05915 [Terracidiphilus sp.]